MTPRRAANSPRARQVLPSTFSGSEDECSGSEGSEPAIVFSGVDFSLMDAEEEAGPGARAGTGRRGAAPPRAAHKAATPAKRPVTPQVVLLPPPGLSEAIGQAIASPDGPGAQQTVELPVVDSTRRGNKEEGPQERHNIPTEGWLSGAAGRLCRGRESEGGGTGEPPARFEPDDPAAEVAFRDAVAGFSPETSLAGRGMAPLLDLGDALAGMDLDGLIERLQNGTCDLGEQDENESFEVLQEALADRKLETSEPSPTQPAERSPVDASAEAARESASPQPPPAGRGPSRPGSARPRSPFMRILQESSDTQIAKHTPEERPKVFLDLTGGASRPGEEESRESSGSELEDEFEEWRNQRAALKGGGGRGGWQGGQGGQRGQRGQGAEARQSPSANGDPVGAAHTQREGGEEECFDVRSGEGDWRGEGQGVIELEAAVGEVEEVVPAKAKTEAGRKSLLGGIGVSRSDRPFLPTGAMGPHELREFLEGSQNFQNCDSPSESSDDEVESGGAVDVAAYGRQPAREAFLARQQALQETATRGSRGRQPASMARREAASGPPAPREPSSNEQVVRARDLSDSESEEDKKIALFERETALMRSRRVALWRAAVLRCCEECPIQTFHEQTSFLPPVPMFEEEASTFTMELWVRDPAQLTPLTHWALLQSEQSGPAAFSVVGVALVANPESLPSESLDIYDKRLVCVGRPSKIDKRDGGMRVFLTSLKRVMQQTSLESLGMASVDGRENIWEVSRTKAGFSELLKPVSPVPVVQGLSAERTLEKDTEICMSYLVWESVNSATVGAVLGRALEEGLELAGLRSVCLKGDKSEAPHLPESGKLLAFALAGRNSVARWKEAIGPNDHSIASITDPLSLRARLSLSGDALIVTAAPKAAHKDFCHFFGGRLDLNGDASVWKPPSESEALSLVALHSTVASWVAISLPDHRAEVHHITRNLAEKGFTSDRIVMRRIDASLKRVSGLSVLEKNTPVLFAKIRKPCLHFYVKTCLAMGQGFYAPSSLAEVVDLDKLLDTVDSPPVEMQSRKVMRKLAKLEGKEKSLRQTACVALSGNLASASKELSGLCGLDESKTEFLGFKQVDYLQPDQQRLFYCGHAEGDGELLRATQKTVLHRRKTMLQKPLILALFRGTSVVAHVKAKCRRGITHPAVLEKGAVIGIAEEGKAVQNAVATLFKDSEIHDDVEGCGMKFFLPFPAKDRVFSLLRGPPVHEVIVVANLNSTGLGKLSRAFHVLHVKGGFQLVATHARRFPADDLELPPGFVPSVGAASVALCLRGTDGVRRCLEFFKAAGLLGEDLAVVGSVQQSKEWRSAVFGQSHAGVLPCEVAGRQGVSLSNLKKYPLTASASQGLLQTTCLMLGPLNVSGPFWDEDDKSIVDGLSSMADVFDLVRREGFRVSNLKLVHVEGATGKDIQKVYSLSDQESKPWASGCQAVAMALTRDNAVARLQMALQKRREKRGDLELSSTMYASSAKASKEDLSFFFRGEELYESALEVQRDCDAVN